MYFLANRTLCHAVCESLAAGRWFSPGIPVSSTNKNDRYDIIAILLKVVLNTIKQRKALSIYFYRYSTTIQYRLHFLLVFLV
jgi:hypothetical protein